MAQIDSSIRQNPLMTGLPDFRNSSVLLPIFLAINLLGVLPLFIAEPDPSHWFRGMADMPQTLEPGLLLVSGRIFCSTV
jgi:hypothetical protein